MYHKINQDFTEPFQTYLDEIFCIGLIIVWTIYTLRKSQSVLLFASDIAINVITTCHIIAVIYNTGDRHGKNILV